MKYVLAAAVIVAALVAAAVVWRTWDEWNDDVELWDEVGSPKPKSPRSAP